MKSIIFVFALALSLGSFASTSDSELDQIKLGCENPAAVGNQIKPARIQINCLDERLVWKPGNRAQTS